MRLKFLDCVDLINQKPVLSDGQITYASTSAADSNGIIAEELELCDFADRPSRANITAISGDVLFARMAATKKAILVDSVSEDYVYSTGFAVARPKPEMISSACLYHLVRSKSFRIAKDLLSTGATQKAITNGGLKKLHVSIPSFAEQGKVCQRLSSIEFQQQRFAIQMSKLDDLVKSRFVEMFGEEPEQMLCMWDCVPLLGCVQSIDTGKSISCKADPREGLEPAVLKLSALSSGIYLSSENKAMLSGSEVVPGKEVHFGDILVARKNTPELVGACVLVKEDTPNLMFPDLVFRMHPVDSVDGAYLVALLGASPFSDSVRALAHGSAKSMSNIPKSDLGKLILPIPPIELQREFAAFVTQVDKTKSAVQQSIDKLQMLYDSLAQEYFGGGRQ